MGSGHEGLLPINLGNAHPLRKPYQVQGTFHPPSPGMTFSKAFNFHLKYFIC